MAITKPPVLPAWADAGDKVQPSNAELSVGWPVSSTPPSRQRFNWVLNYVANAVRYFSRRGLVDYDAAETYMTGDRIIGDDGKTYRSLIDNNTAQTPSSSPTKWERWGFSLADLGVNAQTQPYTAFTTTGATGAFVLTPSPALTAYSANQRFRVKFHAVGNGSDTLAVSGLAAKNLKQYDSTGAKVAPVLAANQLVDVEYDGVDFVLLDQLPYASGSGSKNKLINGALAVDQRNGGASQTFTAAAALAYCVDRWYGYCTGANVSGQRVAGSGGNQYRYQFTGAASVTGIGFGQRIEKINCIDLVGSTATLSVDLANSLLTTVNWTAYYANTDDTFGTLASPTRTQIATGNFTVNGSVTRYSTQIAIPAGATTGIEVVFSVGAQTSGTWIIGNIQLEAGSSSTTFERRLIANELALCQRYGLLVPIGGAQQAGWVASASANIGNISVPFPVTMRSAPSIPTISWTLTQSSTPTVVHGSVNRVDWQMQGTVSNGSVNAANSAAFFLSAEL